MIIIIVQALLLCLSASALAATTLEAAAPLKDSLSSKMQSEGRQQNDEDGVNNSSELDESDVTSEEMDDGHLLSSIHRISKLDSNLNQKSSEKVAEDFAYNSDQHSNDHYSDSKLPIDARHQHIDEGKIKQREHYFNYPGYYNSNYKYTHGLPDHHDEESNSNESNENSHSSNDKSSNESIRDEDASSDESGSDETHDGIFLTYASHEQFPHNFFRNHPHDKDHDAHQTLHHHYHLYIANRQFSDLLSHHLDESHQEHSHETSESDEHDSRDSFSHEADSKEHDLEKSYQEEAEYHRHIKHDNLYYRDHQEDRDIIENNTSEGFEGYNIQELHSILNNNGPSLDKYHHNEYVMHYSEPHDHHHHGGSSTRQHDDSVEQWLAHHRPSEGKHYFHVPHSRESVISSEDSRSSEVDYSSEMYTESESDEDETRQEKYLITGWDKNTPEDKYHRIAHTTPNFDDSMHHHEINRHYAPSHKHRSHHMENDVHEKSKHPSRHHYSHHPHKHNSLHHHKYHSHRFNNDHPHQRHHQHVTDHHHSQDFHPISRTSHQFSDHYSSPHRYASKVT